MTQEEAQAAADAANAILTGQSVTDRDYKLFERYDLNSQSTWGYFLIPTKYNAQWAAATVAQLHAFVRVSNTAQANITTALPDFVINFDAEGPNDPVLQPYLYP